MADYAAEIKVWSDGEAERDNELATTKYKTIKLDET